MQHSKEEDQQGVTSEQRTREAARAVELRSVHPSPHRQPEAERPSFNPSGEQTQKESQQGLSNVLFKNIRTFPGSYNYSLVRTVFSNTCKMLRISLWTLSVTTPDTQRLMLQKCNHDYLKVMNREQAPKCLVSCVLQLSSQCLHLFRGNKNKNRLYKKTIHLSKNKVNPTYMRSLSMQVYWVPLTKQIRLYRDKKTNL